MNIRPSNYRRRLRHCEYPDQSHPKILIVAVLLLARPS